ncbi:MAG: DUF3089 domain-containing protein [Chitinophagales bacterium]
MLFQKQLLSVLIIFFACIFLSCSATKPVTSTFSPQTNPSPPDYSDPFYWSALPDKIDFADHIPSKSHVPLIDGQNSAAVDVFYLYPTSFFSRKTWNADLDDKKVNASTDERAVKNQASVFNGSCRVYIPRYRQVAFQGYFSLTNPDALEAFALAYEDVKTAFQYYLDHYNNGRPIIIAGHSQGTTHAKQLLKDFFDGKPLQEKLVCAYLIGMPVYKGEFTNIPPSDSASQVGCFITWRSYVEGHEPKPKYVALNKENIIVNNPLTYTRSTELASKEINVGGLNRDSETIIPGVCNAQVHEDIVWVSKPDVPGKALLFLKNLHVADYNLYWLTMRENVALRVEKYLAQQH